MFKTTKMWTAPALVMALMTAQAEAQSTLQARTLLQKGQWREATAAALALNTSAGYALASEAATNGAGVMPDGNKKALFLSAQEYARKAISLEGGNPAGHFWLAVAQGRLAQYVGIVESLGMAKDIRRNLERAIELGMNTAPPYVALGLWHATVSTKGVLAALATGASREEAMVNFNKALKLEPDNLTARLEYARALLLLDARGNKTVAISQLHSALTMTPLDFWQQRDLEAVKALVSDLR